MIKRREFLRVSAGGLLTLAGCSGGGGDAASATSGLSLTAGSESRTFTRGQTASFDIQFIGSGTSAVEFDAGDGSQVNLFEIRGGQTIRVNHIYDTPNRYRSEVRFAGTRQRRITREDEAPEQRSPADKNQEEVFVTEVYPSVDFDEMTDDPKLLTDGFSKIRGDFFSGDVFRDVMLPLLNPDAPLAGTEIRPKIVDPSNPGGGHIDDTVPITVDRHIIDPAKEELDPLIRTFEGDVEALTERMLWGAFELDDDDNASLLVMLEPAISGFDNIVYQVGGNRRLDRSVGKKRYLARLRLGEASRAFMELMGRSAVVYDKEIGDFSQVQLQRLLRNFGGVFTESEDQPFVGVPSNTPEGLTDFRIPFDPGNPTGNGIDTKARIRLVYVIDDKPYHLYLACTASGSVAERFDEFNAIKQTVFADNPLDPMARVSAVYSPNRSVEGFNDQSPFGLPLGVEAEIRKHFDLADDLAAMGT